jgi:ArsR family transcriptional regulator, arsenate/arsenite/antimonite-responsive transcriptional repressor
MQNVAVTFATLADPIRLRAIALIAAERELCVCELVAALDLPQPKVSRHLAIMRDAGLLRDRRDAQWVLYSLAPDMPDWMRAAVQAGVAAMANDRQYVKDRRRLVRAARPMRAKFRKVA